ncbi:MAG: hypothetical protein HY909_21465 [Deltaproteobacteria bacterium]|nr:hypothetical protein [Deltaproteobacteria bacterium]
MLEGSARGLWWLALGLGCAPAPPASRGNASCAGCHPTQARALASSRHSRATESDLFRALRARASTADRAFCDGCHTVHDVPGEEGAGCVTCHQAGGNRGVSNARLVLDLQGPVRGPFGSATSAHRSAPGDFLRSADLCGTCHEVQGPGAFVETPYSEWSASPAAQSGITCAGCHMARSPGDPEAPRERGPAAVGGPDRALTDHAFVGPEHQRAAELLGRSASLAMHVVPNGATLRVEVTMTNRNTAHALPSGARFARELWLEVRALTDQGTTVLAGAPEDPRRVELGDRVTRNGLPALPTASDPPEVRALPAAGSRTVTLELPASVGGSPVRALTAVLRFRRNDPRLRQALGLPPDPTGPLDLAAVTHAL